ncbi:MAG: hypothetical protein Q7T03_10335 [Deltaproteobacteria bacterium]|nr:hypothetical protein [Deltaproteobacteria bacterium]
MISGGNEEGIKRAAVQVWCSGFLADYNSDKDETGCPASVERELTWAYTQIKDPLQRDKLDAFLKIWIGQPMENCGSESGAEESGYNDTTAPAATKCMDEYRLGTRRRIQLKNLSLPGMPTKVKAFGENGYVPWAVKMVQMGYIPKEPCPLVELADNRVKRAMARLGAAASMKFNGPHIPAVIYGLQVEAPQLFWQSSDAGWAAGGRLMAGGISRLQDHAENDQTTGFVKAGVGPEYAIFRDDNVSISTALASVMTFNGSEDLGGGGELGLRVDTNKRAGVGLDFILEYIQGELLPMGGAYLYWGF